MLMQTIYIYILADAIVCFNINYECPVVFVLMKFDI